MKKENRSITAFVLTSTLAVAMFFCFIFGIVNITKLPFPDSWHGLFVLITPIIVPILIIIYLISGACHEEEFGSL